MKHLLFLLTLLIPAPEEITLTMADNRTIRTSGVTIDAAAGAPRVNYLEGNGEKALPLREFVEISFPHRRREAPAGAWEFILSNGDILVGVPKSAKGEGVLIQSETMVEVEISLTDLWCARAAAHRALWPPLGDRPREDLIHLAGGDEDRGIVSTFGGDSIAFKSSRFGERSFPLADVAAVVMTSIAAAPAMPGDLYAVATDVFGSSVSGRVASMDGAKVVIETFYKGPLARLSLRLDGATGVLVKNGRVVFLSDLKPARPPEEDPNYIRGEKPLPGDLSCPLQCDRSAAGTPITLRGREYRKGLGVHARSTVAYALEGAVRFQAAAGIDDIARDLGRAVIEVSVDGKKVFSQAVKGGEPPVEIDVPVDGARELVLTADFGENGSQGDYVDWALARLLRK